MNIEELMKELKAIKKEYGNINIYDNKLNGIFTVGVNKEKYNKIIIDFYKFNN